jgi:DNA-binding response OmpR family regulator
VTVPAALAPAVRVLIVDDEPLARTRLRTLLAKHRDVEIVGECAEGSEAIAVIARSRPEVVFLDIQMTDVNGMSVARVFGRAPLPAVVFVTAHEQYALEAFEVRALDYLLKPFDEERFIAALDRVRAYTSALRSQRSHEHLLTILREVSTNPLAIVEGLRAPSMPLRFADLEVDLSLRQARRGGGLLQLRPKEFDLLVALMRRAGELITRRELLDEVWGYSQDVTSRTIDTHVAVFRRKLGHAPGEPGFILTVAKGGYRLRR